MAPSGYSSPARPSRSPVDVLARAFGVGGTGDGIDFARIGGIIGLVSGIIGFVGGVIAIVSGTIGVIGGVFGIVTSGLLGIVAGGVLGVALGGAVGAGIFLPDWNFRWSFSVLMRRDASREVIPAVSSLRAVPSWRIMRAASGLMPPVAGRRWLAEAESFLSEVPAGRRRLAIRNYLLTAPRVIVVSWTGTLARRTRFTGGDSAGGQSNDSGDLCS